MDKPTANIDFKLDYMARLFRKTSHKRFETYVIQRIWHRLDDDRVQFVSQQYVKRVQDDDYALADLYLPQVNIVVEINEPYHYDENQHKRDAIRNAEVSKIAGVQVFVVDCRKPMAELHRDIDRIVDVIRQKVIQLGDKFIPWVGLDERTPAYYQRKGYLLVEDNEYVETIDDICDIFHTKAKHRGFLRAGSVALYGKTELWFPNAENKQWHNDLIEDGKYMLEYPNNSDKTHPWLEEVIWDNRHRITFFRQKDDLGFNYYKFVGVFEIDLTRTTSTDKCYWKLISDRVDLNKGLGKYEESTKKQAGSALQPLKVKEIIPQKSSNSDSGWSREKWENWEKDVKPALKIMDEIVAAMPCIQDGTYQLNYTSKIYIGFAQNGKAKNFATFFPQGRALLVNAWGMENSEEIERIGKALPSFEHKVTSRNDKFHTFKFPVNETVTAEQLQAALDIIDMARKNYEK